MESEADVPKPSDERGAFGEMLRKWRTRRRFSQLALGLEADVSTRHVAFLETGRAQPSRRMVLRLSDALNAPLAERNQMLEAAGFAAAFPSLELDDAALVPVRSAMRRLLTGHMPYPGVLLSGTWDLLDINAAGRALFGNLPMGTNIIELALESAELRAAIVNLPETLQAFAIRLRDASRRAGGDARLDGLRARLDADPALREWGRGEPEPGEAFQTLRIRSEQGQLALFSGTVEFGIAYAVALRDLHLELYFPASEATRAHFEAASRA